MPLVTQWGHANGMYYAVSDTLPEMPPGLYDMAVTNGTLFFVQAATGEGSLIRFPGTPSDEVVSEIQRFWDRQELYKAYGVAHKRGLLLYGPPGSGKSCTLQLVARDVIAAGGFVLLWPGPEIMHIALRQIRDIQPQARVVVLMEDIDALLEARNESAILNLLDGIESYPMVVYLATTNYIERLAPRIANRPSRFDRRFRIDHPTKEARRMYLESLIPEEHAGDVDLEQMVRDTEGMSLAHLKELLVSTQVIGSEYDATVRVLKAMNERPSSLDGDDLPGQYA